MQDKWVSWESRKDRVEKLLETCTTYSEVMRAFGLRHSGNTGLLKKYMQKWGFSFKNYLGSGFNKGLSNCCRPMVPLDTVLVEKSTYSRSSLKRRLITDGLLPNKCGVCESPPEWRGKPLILILDHVNGVNDDNRLHNLRLLCPNCNAQQETFAGRNRQSHGPKRKRQYKYTYKPRKREAAAKHFCVDCGERVRKDNVRCWTCHGISLRKCPRPNREELAALLWEWPTRELASRFGVSDKAITNWTKKYGLTKPGRGYWAKLRSERKGHPIGDGANLESL